MSDPVASPALRIAAIDAVRGFAVLGILVMNIVAFGMPGGAYDDPRVYGGTGGADLIAWAAAFVIADGKMRGLFTMLFGASMAIVADGALARGANPAAVHYRRMGWLLAIGMLHGWLIWYGDILVEYALTGAVLFVVWRLRPVTLFYIAGVFFIGDIVIHADQWQAIVRLQEAASSPGASATVLADWRGYATVDRAAIAAEVSAYRGGFADVFAQRLRDLSALQAGLGGYLIESIGTATLGIALLRTGYFTRLPARWHRRLVAIGYGIAVPLMIAIAAWTAARGFDPESRAAASLGSLLLRPPMMLAHASLVILLVDGGRLRWLSRRLAAAGRMALSNYLATSIVMTSLFYGYGAGLFGGLSRAELYLPVVAMWLAMLGWSLPWLARFRYGPAEWLWRSLARWQWQPLRGPAAGD